MSAHFARRSSDASTPAILARKAWDVLMGCDPACRTAGFLVAAAEYGRTLTGPPDCVQYCLRELRPV